MGAPTSAPYKARGTHDFEAERARCLRLVDEFAAKPLDDQWVDSPALGHMTGRDHTRMQAKHLNHHLTQFGV
jgi:hypothetical protein